MTEEQKEQQIQAIHKSTTKACKSKASAIKFLKKAGIITTPTKLHPVPKTSSQNN